MNKRYRCSFQGRPLGALGTFNICYATVEAKSPTEARLKLYDDFEHIAHLRVREDEEGTEWEKV